MTEMFLTHCIEYHGDISVESTLIFGRIARHYNFLMLCYVDSYCRILSKTLKLFLIFLSHAMS